jgi:phosphatidyl-myo-inositol dimannoside synthase
MKKSLLVTLDFPPKIGGVSHQLFNIAVNFPKQNLVVLTDEADQATQNPKVSIYRQKIITSNPLIWPKWLPLVWQIKKLITAESIRLLQVGQILPIGTIALIFNKLKKVPYIVYVYGMDLVTSRHSAWKTYLIRKILQNASGIVANSGYTKELAVKSGALEKRIIIAYPCPNLKKMNAADEKQIKGLRQHYNLVGLQVILSVGNLVKRKGHDFVLKGLVDVIKKNDKIRYVIIGSGPELSKLQELVQQLQLQKYVFFPGKVRDADLQSWYEICDIFVMPSRTITDIKSQPIDLEGFGMVFLEANTYGKPVIGGRSGGQHDAIEENKSGLLVNPVDSNEIALAILKLLSNENLRRQIGEYGRQRVVNSFQWPQQVDKIIQLVETI